MKYYVKSEPLALSPKETGRRRKNSGSVGNQGVPDQYFSRAVGKALEILELLQTHESPLGLSDVAHRIGLTKASTHRLLRTLLSSGYLTTTADGAYAFRAELRSTVPSQFPMRLRKVATPTMMDLSRQLRETVSLAILFENRSEVVSVIESPEIIRMANVVGHILPPNASSLGKVITAFQSVERHEKLLRSFGIYRFTENTITDRSDLNQEYALIRNQGFATDREETVLGGLCFGFPIFSASGEDVTAALSVSVPKLRLGPIEREESIRATLSAAARDISAALL
jgi:DNA-binding IclR family transcriptional regulator